MSDSNSHSTAGAPQRPLRRSLLFAGAQQFVVLFLAGAVVLDGGTVLLMFLYAFAAHWVGVGILVARRRSKLGKLDRVFVEWGFPDLCVLSLVLAPVVWRLRGVAWY